MRELKTDRSPDGSRAPAVDAFAAFVGVAARPSVVAVADFVVRRLADVAALVLGTDHPPSANRGVER